MSNSLEPYGQYSPWNSPGQNTGVGSLSLLQGSFPTQGSNQDLSHCRRILYQLSHKGSLFLGNNTREKKNDSCLNEAEFLAFIPWNFLLCSGVMWRNYCHLQNWLENWCSRICLDEVVTSLFEQLFTFGPWRRKWQPTSVLLPGKCHGWRNLVGYSPWGHKESDTTEQLHLSLLAQWGFNNNAFFAKGSITGWK